jgi:hypothetical protein
MRSYQVFVMLMCLVSICISITALRVAGKWRAASDRWRQAAAAWQRLAMQHGCPVKEKDVIKLS